MYNIIYNIIAIYSNINQINTTFEITLIMDIFYVIIQYNNFINKSIYYLFNIFKRTQICQFSNK